MVCNGCLRDLLIITKTNTTTTITTVNKEFISEMIPITVSIPNQ